MLSFHFWDFLGLVRRRDETGASTIGMECAALGGATARGATVCSEAVEPRGGMGVGRARRGQIRG